VHKRLIRFEGGSGAKWGSKSNDGRGFAVIDAAHCGSANSPERVVNHLEQSGLELDEEATALRKRPPLEPDGMARGG